MRHSGRAPRPDEPPSAPPITPVALFAWPLFATAVAGHETRREALLADILAHRERAGGLVRSNRSGGWHSDPSFMALRTPALGWLLQSVSAFARAALASRYDGWARSEPRIGSYWANVSPKDAWNAPHHHAPQHWSAVYYVAVPATGPDAGGELVFLNPSSAQSPWGADRFVFTPREGNLLLFPSPLVHLVEPHDAEQERVSVALNLDVVARG